MISVTIVPLLPATSAFASVCATATYSEPTDGQLTYSLGSDCTATITGSTLTLADRHTYYLAHPTLTFSSTVTVGGDTYTVTTIGVDSFRNIRAIEQISLPPSVTKIDNYAFYWDTIRTLSAADIPGVTTLGEGAFDWNDTLTSVTLPEGITAIPLAAFQNNPALISVTLPSTLTDIGEWAFSSSPITSLIIPSGVVSVGGNAFRSLPPNSVVTFLGDPPTSLGSGAFPGSVVLEFPSGVLPDCATIGYTTTSCPVTVRFNSGEGGSPVPDQVVTYGGTITQPANPTRPDSVFIGWATDPWSDTQAAFPYSAQTSTTWHAIWRPLYVTVSFDTGPGGSVVNQIVTYGDTITQPAHPTRPGFSFTGWYTSRTGGSEVTFPYTVSESVTIYAVWQATTISQRIPVGESPISVVMNREGTTAYVTNFDDSSISVIDIASNTVTDTIEVLFQPIQVAITPDGTKAYVAYFYPEFVTVIDLESHSILGYIPVPCNEGGGIAFAPNGLAYVACDDGLAVIDSATNNLVDVITGINDQTFWVAVTPDGSTAFVTSLSGLALKAVDLASLSVLSVSGMGDTEISSYSVAISPDGTTAYLPNLNDGTVRVIDVRRMQQVGSISVGLSPTSLTFSPDGLTVFVTNIEDGQVSVIDVATRTVRTTLELGDVGPFGIAVTPDGSTLYIAGFGNSSVVVMKVPVADPTPVVRTEPALAYTGVDASMSVFLGVIASILFALGGVLILTRRRVIS